MHYAAANLLALLLTGYTSTTARLHLNNKRATTISEPIRGVNLGGWLVTEQWITPSVYDSSSANDEWHLCNELGKEECAERLDGHWSSFYTRTDLQAIRAAGLNAVRIPIGYWAVDLEDYEPYVSGQYPYLIRAVQWTSSLGLSVLIDLHGAPGSQNGQDNSGLIGPVDFTSNTTNAERSLNVLRNLTAEFSQGMYNGTVIGIELLNEPRLNSGNFTMVDLQDFYAEGAETIQNATVDTAMNVSIHDAFWGPNYWVNYNPTNSGASQPASDLLLDTHQYYAFEPLNNLSHSQILDSVCNISQLLKRPGSGIPSTFVGEWSLETGAPPRAWSSSQDQGDDQTRRTWFRLLAEAQMVAYTPDGAGQASVGWYFWAWKTEYDIDTWSYRRGLSDGWIPSDASNTSTYAFPVLENGCVDTTYNYTAPRRPGRSGGGRPGRSGGGRVSASWVLLGICLVLLQCL
ncbi:hypothetical protein LTR27_012626 [Elasticomyces elasticus]|nr:hypothetical protein LTR27_012626 [Elasticomyces elasticus]